ncbi:hypothetical protein B566_EDAN004910 [Ephemera danica]|nr:hypothetical protein B566_EDAN004910 [Ephemera danica]
MYNAHLRYKKGFRYLPCRSGVGSQGHAMKPLHCVALQFLFQLLFLQSFLIPSFDCRKDEELDNTRRETSATTNDKNKCEVMDMLVNRLESGVDNIRDRMQSINRHKIVQLFNEMRQELLTENSKLKVEIEVLKLRYKKDLNRLNHCYAEKEVLEKELEDCFLSPVSGSAGCTGSGSCTTDLQTCTSQLGYCRNNGTILNNTLNACLLSNKTCNSLLDNCTANNTNLQRNLTNCNSALQNCTANNTAINNSNYLTNLALENCTNDLETCATQNNTCWSLLSNCTWNNTILANNLSSCNTSLYNCNANVTALNSSLNTCLADNATCKLALQNCSNIALNLPPELLNCSITNLNSCLLNVSSLNNSLNACILDNEICSVKNADLEKNLTALNETLTQCLANNTQCQTNLTSSEAAVALCSQNASLCTQLLANCSSALAACNATLWNATIFIPDICTGYNCCQSLQYLKNICTNTILAGGNTVTTLNYTVGGVNVTAKYYFYYSSSSSALVTWYEALAKCQSLGMTLIAFETAAEEIAVNSYFLSIIGGRAGQSYWTSLNSLDKPNVWVWVSTGVELTPSMYSNWQAGTAPSTSSSPCVMDNNVSGNFMKWQQNSCNAKSNFICELKGACAALL